jgi:hypothetical protein
VDDAQRLAIHAHFRVRMVEPGRDPDDDVQDML